MASTKFNVSGSVDKCFTGEWKIICQDSDFFPTNIIVLDLNSRLEKV